MNPGQNNRRLDGGHKSTSPSEWPRKAKQLFEAASAEATGRFLPALLKPSDEPVDWVLLQRDLRAIRCLAKEVAPEVSNLPQLLEAFADRLPQRNSGLEEALRRVRSLAAGRLIGRRSRQETAIPETVMRGVQRQLRRETRKLPAAVQSVLANSRAHSTQRSERSATKVFIKGGFDPRHDDIRRFLVVMELLARTRSANTVVAYASHLLHLVRQLRGEDWRESKLIQAMMAGLKRRGDCVCHTPPLKLSDLLRIVAVIDGRSLVGRRDRALLLIGFAFGFRCSELCRLRWAEVVLPAGQKLQISAVTKVSKKTVQILDTDNDFYRLIASQLPLLDEILLDYRQLLPDGTCYLWPQISANDEVMAEAIKPHQFRALFRKYSAIAGVAYHRPHSLRAGCITELARRGATTLEIARTSGHRTDRMILQYSNLALASLR